jgi:hypothetical protein
MKISKVEVNEEGNIVATVVDDEGVVVGYNVYSEESLPLPEVTE